MLAELHAGKCAGGMHVVRGGDDNGVDLLPLLVEHLPEVLVLFRLRPGIKTRYAAGEVDVAQGDYVLDSRLGGGHVEAPRPPAPIAARFSFSFGDL